MSKSDERKKSMKTKIFWGGTLFVILFTVFVSTAVSVNAATISKTIIVNNRNYVCSMTDSYAQAKERKLNAIGFEKNDFTTGSVTVTKTKDYTFNSSASISAEHKAPFVEVGTTINIGLSVSKSVAVGTSINVTANAPNGIYYAYIGLPHKKIFFQSQSCSLNYTDWGGVYKVDLAYAPMTSYEYLFVRAL